MIAWIVGVLGVVIIVVVITVAATWQSRTEATVEDRKDIRDAENEKQRPLKLWEKERKGNQP